jgi:hypothetical protein
LVLDVPNDRLKTANAPDPFLSNHDDVVGAKQTKAAEQSRQSPALVVTLAVLFAPVWPVVCQE